MVLQVIRDERLDETVAVVTAHLHPRIQRLPRFAGGSGESFW